MFRSRFPLLLSTHSQAHTHAHTCPHMRTHAHTCPHMPTHAHTCPHAYTCSHMPPGACKRTLRCARRLGGAGAVGGGQWGGGGGGGRRLGGGAAGRDTRGTPGGLHGAFVCVARERVTSCTFYHGSRLCVLEGRCSLPASVMHRTATGAAAVNASAILSVGGLVYGGLSWCLRPAITCPPRCLTQGGGAFPFAAGVLPREGHEAVQQLEVRRGREA